MSSFATPDIDSLTEEGSFTRVEPGLVKSASCTDADLFIACNGTEPDLSLLYSCNDPLPGSCNDAEPLFIAIPCNGTEPDLPLLLIGSCNVNDPDLSLSGPEPDLLLPSS